MKRFLMIRAVCGCLIGLATFNSARSVVTAQEVAARKLPDGPLGEVVKLGEELVEKTTTHSLTREFVGNRLNCTSCHLKNGTDPKAASLEGVATAYPAWSPREKRVITLEDRVLNCFMRSCNGIRPPLGSKPSVAMTAYITWLSSGQSIKQNGQSPLGPLAVQSLTETADKADLERGRKLYLTKCSSCHTEDGGGDDQNPPVWGDQSYNQGAGLADSDKLAAWLKVSMPLDNPDLTELETLDIAVYVNSHSRPAFVLEDHLPKDDRLGQYNSESSQKKQ